MKLNPIISDGAIFEANEPIVIFGEGQGHIRAEMSGGMESAAECDADGRFVLSLPPQKAGGPYEIRVTDGRETVILRDILVGRVIFLSGQSNAELPAKDTYLREKRFADNPSVRLFQVDKDVKIEPPSSLTPDLWTYLTAENALEWSAIALCTAIYFNEKTGVPVGIVGGFQGASVIESYLSEEANSRFDIDMTMVMYDHFYPEFADFNVKSYLYHHIIEKIIPYRMGAVVWYQGESNRTEYEATFYDKMLICLVDEWRRLFEKPDLPFVIVQINGFPEPPEPEVTAIQAAQERAAAAIKGSALVKISDMGEHEKIHPENKAEVSARICAALESLNF